MKNQLLKIWPSRVYTFWLLLLVMITCTNNFSAFGQVGSYTHTNNTPFTPITGGTTFTFTSLDDGTSPLMTIPFSFTFGGVSYTSYGVNSNGWLKFGAIPGSTTAYSSLSSTQTNLLAFVSVDLQNIGATWSTVTVGTAPNRIHIIEGLNFYRYNTSTMTGNVQVWLYEGTNNIEIHYGAFATTWASSCQVGVKGVSTATTEITSLNGTGTATWTAPARTNLSGSTMQISGTTTPISGQTIVFSPAPGSAVIGNYLVRNQTPFTPIVGGTTFTFTSLDDGTSPLMSIPFTFNFGGIGYTSYGVNSNGWLKFGAIPGSTTAYSSLSSTQTTLLAYLSVDLQNIGATWSTVTVGTAPYRIHIIEGLNFYRYNTSTQLGNVQVWLYETSNAIEVRYGAFATTWASSCQLGVKGISTATTEITSLSGTGTATWTAPTRTNLSGSTMQISGTTTPINGQTVAFLPPTTVACTGTPSAGNTISSVSTACSGATVNLSITGTFVGLAGITYQWQSAPDISGAPGTFTNISGTNETLSTTFTGATKWYQCVVSCAGGGSSNSTPVKVTLISDLCVCNAYPAIYATSTFDEEITNVIIGTMNNSSVCNVAAPGPGSLANQYSNYTTTVSGASALPGASVSFSVTQSTCNGAYENITQIFADWTQDGDFLDAGEMVYNAPSSLYGNNTRTGSFTVPFTAIVGSTRIRVVNIEYYAPFGPAATTNYAHTSYSWGETEDYCFTVLPPPPCVGTPAPGNTVSSVSSTCPSTAFNLSLQNPTAGSGVIYEWQSAPDVAGAPGTFATVGPNAPTYSPSITAKTWFRCNVTCGTNTGTSAPVAVDVAICVGSGTGTNAYLPIYSFYGYNYSQQIYLASEITAGGGAMGTITKIRFYLDNGGLPETTWKDWKIFLGNTSLNNLSSTTGWVPVNTLTQVFDGQIPVPVTGQWMELTLSTPFFYTGGNMIVAVDENTPAYSGTAYWGAFSTSAASGPRGMLYYSDVTNPDPNAPPTANYSSTTDRARLQLAITPPPPCLAPMTVTANSITATSASISFSCPFCTGNYIVEYGPTGFTPGLGASAGGGTIVTGSSSPIALSGLSPTTTYQVYVRQNCTGSGNGFSENSTVISFTTPCVPIPVVITPSSPTICQGASVNLSATGGNGVNYVWTPSGSLNTGTGSSVIATPATTTTYTVFSATTSTLTYNENFVANVTPVAQAISWCNFRNTLLGTYTYTSLTVKGSQNPTGITLSDPTAVAAIANALRTGTNYTVTVAGNTWYVATGCLAGSSPCSGSPGMSLSVNTSSCNCDAASSNVYVVRPEINNLNWGGINTITCGAPSQSMIVEFGYIAGCVSSQSVTVDVTPAPVVFASATPSNICSGGSSQLNASQTSTITYHISASQLLNVPINCGNGPYTNCNTDNAAFTWNDTGVGTVTGIQVQFGQGVECHAVGSTHTTFMNATAGPSYVTTVNNCFCTYTTPPIVTVNLGPGGYNVGGANTFAIGNNNTCLGFQNGGALGADYATVTVTYLTSGTPTYVWSNASYLNNANIANPIASGMTSTQTFTVVATANGCDGPPSSVTVSANPATVSISSTANGQSCIGVPVTLTADAASGVAPYSYLWSNGSTSSAITVTPSTSTTYTVTVTDGCGATTASSFVDIVNPILTSTTAGSRCGAGTVDLFATAPSGTTIKWYDALTGGNTLGTGPTFTTPLITSTTDYYVAGTGGGGGPGSLATSAFGGNNQSGNMFDVQVLNAVTVTSMSFNFLTSGTYTAQIYYRVGTHVGNETNSGAWTLLGTANSMFSSGGITPVPVTLNLALSAGTTYAFYVTLVGSTNMSYTNGTAVGNTWASDANLIIKEGVGVSNPLGSFFFPRNWNGVINYTSGCESLRELVTATVTPAPPISATTSQALVCIGTSSTVSVSSGNPNYTYTWTSTPAGFNATGPGPHTVVATGSGTAYHVYAFDAGTQCGAYETVEINTTTNNLSVAASSTSGVICSGESTSLNAIPNEGGATAYCIPQSWCGYPDIITNVTFSTVSNPSGCNEPSNPGAFTYFDYFNPTLSAGTTYPLTVSTGGDLEGIAVWADWNQNKVFESTELIYSGYFGTNPATYNTSIPVPMSAYNGETRIRVRCQYANDPVVVGSGPCGSYTYGETEDYLVTVTGGVVPSTSGYTYVWSPATYLSSTTVANPTASNVTSPTYYTVQVTSAATGCIATDYVDLGVNPLPEPIAFNGGPYCENQPGNLFGSGGLYYTWTGPNGFISYDVNPATAPLTIADGGLYTLTVEDGNGCTNSVTNFLVVNPNPVVDYVTPGNETCLGLGDGTIEIGISSGDGSYSTTDGASLSSFDSPATFTGVTPGTYFFSISDGNNCATSTAAVVGTDPNLPPVITCPSNVNINNAAGICGSPYSYSVLGEDACPGVGSVIQTAGLASGGTFPVGTTTNSFIVYDVLGASSTCSFNITVTDTEVPTIANAPASLSSCNPISWTPPTITDNCPGVVIQSSHVPGTVFPSGITTVTYTATDAYNQVSTYSFDVTVLEPSVAASSIASSRDFNNICAGENITLSVVGGFLGDGASWKWYTGSCSGTLIGTGPSIVVTPATTTTYYVRAEGTCGPSACTSLQVVVSTSAPLGSVTLTTVPPFGAPGITDVLSVNPVVGATYYQWSTNNGQINGVLFNGALSPVQTSVPTVNITFVLPQSNYQIRVLAGNACGRTGTANSHIRGTVAAPTSLTGPTQVCPNQTASYTVSAIPSQSGNVSYNWVLIPASAGTISGTGLTRSVTFAPGFTTAQLCVNGISSFGLHGAPLCITISTNAPVPGAITGNANPCSGSTSTYSIAPVPSATSYIWTVLGNPVSGQTGSSANITFPGGSFSGNVCVQSVSSCGTSAPSCFAVVSGAPGNPGPISGPTQGICGATNVNYSLATSGATYNWILPVGVIPSGPTNLNSINVNFSGTFAGGIIEVQAQYACGSPVSSTISVSGEPTTPTVNPATICANSTELYFASSTGATGYNWTVNSAVDAFCTNPPICSQYYMEWGPGGGSFSVTATNGCGTSAPFNLSTNCRISQNGTLETKVYPNPNTGQFIVELNSYAGGNHNLTITDLSGRVILVKDVKATSGMNQYDMDLGFANAGLYMLYVKDADGMISVTKIVVE